MSQFSAAAGRMNASQLRVMGDPITYLSSGGATLSITAIRGIRDPQENEQLAAFERIWTRRGQFPADPVKGDQVVIGTEQYVVFEVKPDADPSSDGLTIYLNRRPTL